MKKSKSGACVLGAIMALVLSGCVLFFPYEDYDYTLDSLPLGAAFPNAGTAAEAKKSAEAMSDLGLSWVRIGCDWSMREPAEDSFYWDPLEFRLEAFEDAGISVLLTIETHDWPSWLPVDAEHDDTETLAQFREFVSKLLSLYGGKIRRIQVGNEWNWEIDDYFNGNEEAYISYVNILAEEVTAWRSSAGTDYPTIVLGSFSARHALAYDQGLITEIIIEGVSVYENQIAAYSLLPEEERITVRVENILANGSYEMLDIHLYDDYDAWYLYLQALRTAYTNATGNGDIPVIVSEYGGPYPADLYYIFGLPSRNLLAQRLVDYVHALDSLDVEEVYFFKLQKGGTDVQHRNSFLLDEFGCPTPAYNVMKRFGNP